MDHETQQKAILAFMAICTAGAIALFLLPFFREPPQASGMENDLINFLDLYHQDFNDLPEDIHDLEKQVEVDGVLFGPCVPEGTIESYGIRYNRIDQNSFEIGGKTIELEASP